MPRKKSTRPYMQFEHVSMPLLPRKQFYSRVTRHVAMAMGVLALSLGLGIVGYMVTEGYSFVDALLNAAMLLGGMGQINPLYTVWGKVFASFYSVFSGMVFLVVAGVVMAPLVHRFLHRLHVEKKSES